MRFGICTDFKKNEGKIEIPHIKFIKECGFDYLELNLTSVSALTDDEFLEFNAYLKENDMECDLCNCFIPGSIPMVGENYSQTLFEVYVEKAVQRGADLGCKKLVLGSGGSRSIPSGFDKNKGKNQFFNALDFIVSEVEKYGMELELEHLNRGESNIITTFEESAIIAEEKNRAGLKSIIDYYHFAMGNENLNLISIHKNAIGHVHFAKPQGRCYPMMCDLMELEPFFTAIKNIGYNDTFSMECAFTDMEDEPKEYKKILNEFKNYFSTDMIKKVENIRLNKKYNCCQCIVCTYADKLGISEEQAFKLSEALGGGIAGTGETCGAVTAMAIVGGFLESSGTVGGKKHTYQTVRHMVEEFKKKNKSIICRELKGISTEVPIRSCMDCIKDATEIIENSL